MYRMGSWARWCRVFFFVLASIVALAGSVCDGFLLRRYPIRPTVVPKKKVEKRKNYVSSPNEIMRQNEKLFQAAEDILDSKVRRSIDPYKEPSNKMERLEHIFSSAGNYSSLNAHAVDLQGDIETILDTRKDAHGKKAAAKHSHKDYYIAPEADDSVVISTNAGADSNREYMPAPEDPQNVPLGDVA